MFNFGIHAVYRPGDNSFLYICGCVASSNHRNIVRVCGADHPYDALQWWDAPGGNQIGIHRFTYRMWVRENRIEQARIAVVAGLGRLKTNKFIRRALISHLLVSYRIPSVEEAVEVLRRAQHTVNFDVENHARLIDPARAAWRGAETMRSPSRSDIPRFVYSGNRAREER